MSQAVNGMMTLISLVFMIAGIIYTLGGLYGGWDTWVYGIVMIGISMILFKLVKVEKKDAIRR